MRSCLLGYVYMLAMLVIGPIQIMEVRPSTPLMHCLISPSPPPHVESCLGASSNDGLAGILAPCILPEAHLPLYTCFYHIDYPFM
jgi:hypothetical protein